MKTPITHPEPVELKSEGLSVGKFEEMVQEPVLAEELSTFVMYGTTAGTSQSVKVRFYSLDVSKPNTMAMGYAESATISLGSVPEGIANDLVTNEFERAVLSTRFCGIEFTSNYINRVSVNEEVDGKASLVLDVGSPRIFNSKKTK